MFLEDETEFKKRYCEVNHIKSRDNLITEEQGEINYTIKSRKTEGR